MDTLNQMFMEEIRKIYSPPRLGSMMIRKKFKEQGIILTSKQLKKLQQDLENYKIGETKLSLNLNNTQLKQLKIEKSKEIVLDFVNVDEELQKLLFEINEKFSSSVLPIVNEISLIFLPSLKKNFPSMLKARRNSINGFEKRLQTEWKKPFDLLEILLTLILDVGSEINNDFRNNANQKDDYLFDVLTRLHARACQISFEVLTLIKSGYADGAHARWRCLHEVTVTASFIKLYGNEMAERYLLHENIESLKGAKLNRDYFESMNFDTSFLEEVTSLQSTNDELIKRFGKSYGNEYGWASSVIKKDNPSFRDIEKHVGLDHFRPHYKLASHNIHANSKGILYKLGLAPNRTNILLAGPSNFGFSDPAQCTAISLGNLTGILLTLYPTMDHLIICKIIDTLVSEICDEFYAMQQDVEKRENNLLDNEEM